MAMTFWSRGSAPVPYALNPEQPWMARRLRPPHRSRLHAALDRRRARRCDRYATIAAAVDAGITIFDTAHVYGPDQSGTGAQRAARRPGAASLRCPPSRADHHQGRHDPDSRRVGSGRARKGDPRRLRGQPAPPWTAYPSTSISSTRRTREHPGRHRYALSRGCFTRAAVRRVGLSNVTRRQLQEAVDLVEITAVEVAMSPLDDSAVRSGLLDFCAARGIAVIAHSPLGGPRRARSLARRRGIAWTSRELEGRAPRRWRSRGCSRSPRWWSPSPERDARKRRVPPPGPRRSSSRRANAHALPRASGGTHPGPHDRQVAPPDAAEVVVVMGVPGAGRADTPRTTWPAVTFASTATSAGARSASSIRTLDDALSSGARNGSFSTTRT